MKVYVIARSTEKELVRHIYRQLQVSGHEISFDWTRHKNIKPYDENPKIARQYATEDMEGLRYSDVVLYITSKQIGAGTSTELGGAIATQLATGKPAIYAVGEFASNNCFHFHPAVQIYNTVEDVLAELGEG